MVNILHQADVEAVIDEKLVAYEAGDTVLGDSATLDVGTTVGTVAAGDDSRFAQIATPVTSTTAALAAIGNAINTTGKVAGKMVFNTTTGVPVWAVGSAAGDVWNVAAGTTGHTPV